METFDCVRNRASTRAYSAKPVERALLEKVVDAGRRAPTARGVEPWEFVVVTDRQVLLELGTLAVNGSFIKEAACCIALFCRDTKYYLEDGCAATENMLLVASDMGLGACWVAGDKKPYAARVSGLLGAPQDMKLVSLISIGWPLEKMPAHKKRALKEVLHWEKF